MYLFLAKKIKVTIEYENQSNIFELFPYDTINILKEAIINYFPRITFNPIFLLQNKQINDNTIQISDLSKGKDNITITMMKPLSSTIQEIRKNSSDDKTLSMQLNCKCNNPIGHFCSNCREFICINCKSNHKEHKTYLFNKDSIEDSVKVYGISLQADISNEMNKYKEIESMFKDNLLIDFHSWKEMIVRKLDKIETIFKSFEDFEEIFQTQCQHVERISLDTSNKIEKIVNDYVLEGKKSNNIIQVKDLFNNLSNAEEVIDFLSKENDSRKEEFDINKKINELFTSLDYIIEEINTLSHSSYKEISKKTNNSSIVKVKHKDYLSPIRNNSNIRHNNHFNISKNNHNAITITESNQNNHIRKQPDTINRLSFISTRKKLTTPSPLISFGEYNKYFKTVLNDDDDLEKDIVIQLLTKRDINGNKSKRKNRDKLKCSVQLPNIKHL